MHRHRTSMLTVAAALAFAPACKHHERLTAEPDAPRSVVWGLPPITSGEPLAPAEITVTAGSGTLRLNGADVAPLPSDMSHGLDATWKRSGPTDLYLVPLATALARARDGGARWTDGARIELGPEVTYRVFVEVAFTLGQSEVSTFRLVAPSAGGLVPRGALGEIRSRPPRVSSLEDQRRPKKPSLGLTIIVVHDGVSVKARGGNVAPGCNDVGPGLTLARGDGGSILPDLASCLVRLKGAAPDFAEETSATISASPEMTFRDLLPVIDEVRGERRDRFPDIVFGIAR